VVLRGLLGRQNEGLQMTKDEALKALIEDLRLNHEYCTKEVILQAADELEKALIQPKSQFKSEPKDQAHLLHITIQSAVNVERENCARLCDAYELPDVAQAIRTRGHR